MKNDQEKLEIFEQAFSTHTGGCRRSCACGKEYWDGYNSGYSWEEGEIERLEADPNSLQLPHSVSTLEFEGSEYVMDCTCWHPRALKIMGFLDTHAQAICDYFKLEKKRKEEIAKAAPTVEDA